MTDTLNNNIFTKAIVYCICTYMAYDKLIIILKSRDQHKIMQGIQMLCASIIATLDLRIPI